MGYFLKIAAAGGSKTISDPISLSVSCDINDFDVCEFVIPATVTGLRQFQRVEALRAQDGADEVIFSGTIYSVEASIETLTVTCRSDKAILQKKLVLADTTISAQPANTAVGGLLLAWNSAYGESWTVDSAVTTAVTKEFKQGDRLFDAIEEIAGAAGCVWRAEGTVIKMAHLLGTDRTVPGTDYAIVQFDKADPWGSNCGDVKVETYETLSNVLVSSDGTSKRTDSDAGSVAANGPLGEYKEFREGGLAAAAAEYLASKKVEQKVVTVTVEFAGEPSQPPVPADRYLAKEDGGAILKEDGGLILVTKAAPSAVVDPLSAVKCGDKIALRVANCGEYLDIDASVIVNRLNLRVENGSELVTLGLSETYAYIRDLSKKLAQIENQAYLNSL